MILLKGVSSIGEFSVVVVLFSATLSLSLFRSLDSVDGFLVLVRHHRHPRSQDTIFSLEAKAEAFHNLLDSMAITTRKKQQQQQQQSKLRFKVGDPILCYCSEGWTLGKVVALHYREDHWPKSQATAPYQVMLEDYDRRLIFVPIDDDRICRHPTKEELRVAGRLDALDGSNDETNASDTNNSATSDQHRNPNLTPTPSRNGGVSGYRDGTCECCDSCPRSWTAVELYSEHYRAAVRNKLPIVRHSVDLGRFEPGDAVTVNHQHQPDNNNNNGNGNTTNKQLNTIPFSGFLQCPTLPRLPPGITFGDDGSLEGTIRFDPYRGNSYRVEFVAVSTVDWQRQGLVRLQISFEVANNNSPPPTFDAKQFETDQQRARDRGNASLQKIYEAWDDWENNRLDHPGCVQKISLALQELRILCEEHPRLDDGIWWTQLGGYYMNVHKLLENRLFECELYLGQALLQPKASVRKRAEGNLDGCYKKRLLETARFVWYEGLDQVIEGDYDTAIQTFRAAASKKEGWGWGVNHGDMYIAEAAALVLHGAHQIRSIKHLREGHKSLEEIPGLLDKAKIRWNYDDDADSSSNAEHPWALDVRRALNEHSDLLRDNASTKAFLESFRERTVLWCTHAIQGFSPFPPKVKPRQDKDAAEELRKQMPGHHPHSY